MLLFQVLFVGGRAFWLAGWAVSLLEQEKSLASIWIPIHTGTQLRVGTVIMYMEV